MVNSIIEKETNDITEEALSNMEKDTIGEILNISTGSAATSLSALLGRKVDITTPNVSMRNKEDLEYKSLEPAMGVQIEYIEGLSGSTIMIFKQEDLQAILKILLGDDDKVDFENLDEIHQSAMGEIMNQMMGASATALADFLGKDINISTPQIFKLTKDIIKTFYKQDVLVVIQFKIIVEDTFSSEFMSIVPLSHSKQLVSDAMNMSGGGGTEQTVFNEEASIDMTTPTMVNNEKAKEIPQVQQPAQPVQSAPYVQNTYQPPKSAGVVNERTEPVKVQPVKLANFDETPGFMQGDSTSPNFDLILGVPLEVSVEIGKTRKTVKEVLDIRQGAIIELDKQAGDPVDVIVNGQLIAKGDVVVIDDNFGVRITEILTNKDMFNPAK